jgi:hypothetical protein
VSLFEDPRELVPEGFTVYIVSFRIIAIIFFHRIEHAARGERAALTPAITVVVDTLDEPRIVRQI